MIDCLTVLFLISSNFIVFPFLPLPACFRSSPKRSERKQPERKKDITRPTEGGRARVAARCVPNCLWVIVWREAGASARATEGALARRAYARDMASEQKKKRINNAR